MYQALSRIDFRSDIALSVRKGRMLSRHDLAHFRIGPIHPQFEGAALTFDESADSKQCFAYEAHIDAPVALSLFFDGHPVAVMSGVPLSEDEFLIKQIQGVVIEQEVKGRPGRFQKVQSWCIEPIEWDMALMRGFCRVLHHLQMTTLSIQPAKQNEHLKPKLLDLFERRYDKFCQNRLKLNPNERGHYSASLRHFASLD